MTRSRTTERKRTRDKQQRRRRLVMLAVAATTIVAVVVILWFVSNQPAEAPIAEGAAERFPTELESRTTDGFPRFGRVNAPLEVSWFCQFDSPDCVAFHEAAIDQLATWARDGEIVLTYVPLYGQVGNTRGAARAVVCAAHQQSAWPLISSFFQWREAYGDVQAFRDIRITGGINQLANFDSGAYGGCVRGGEPDTTLVEAQNDVRGLAQVGFNQAPPAVTLNGVVLVDADGQQLRTADEVLAALEVAIAGTTRLQPTPVPTTQPEATVEPTEEATEAPAEATETATEAPVVEATEAVTVDSEPTAEATAD